MRGAAQFLNPSPNLSPKRGEVFSPFPRREGGQGVRSPHRLGRGFSPSIACPLRCHAEAQAEASHFRLRDKPLLVGSVVGALATVRIMCDAREVSVPYWSGQWLQLYLDDRDWYLYVSVPYWSGPWLQLDFRRRTE